MDIVKEMAEAITATFYGKDADDHNSEDWTPEALACLPVMERWLRNYRSEHKGSHFGSCGICNDKACADRIADELAAMRKEAGDGK